MARMVLALNAGSSNLKAGLFEAAEGRLHEAGRTLFETQGRGVSEAVGQALAWAEAVAPGEEIAAVGHRIVHGGARFDGPAAVTPEVLAALEDLCPLAPLHQPQGLEAIAAAARQRPRALQVAAFDTAFHRTLPEVATRFALPRQWHDRGVRRYGFHGLSYRHLAMRLAAVDPGLAGGRVLAAHLGAGASLCALENGRSVDTTMGFSALDGLVMATRPGALDPGAVLHLIRREGLSPEAVEDLLYRRSGLLGVSAISGDMRALLTSPAPEAREAVDLFVWRAAREAAGLAGVLQGLDGVVFTGGVGEHSPQIRGRIASRLAWLGLELDPHANALGGERLISTPSSRIRAWIIPADEERVIAGQARAVAALP